ncbi:vanadium-dependent haloperoxidase [Virgibacillus sp. DJP39]|uniref:vanadium-dependent haloperoxidase n=1 Tax=Virgibacillus sp. DJP39 TaxID=3409790 RepID=UPI003BB52CFF
MKNYLKWSEVPYAGESNLPNNPVTPVAGSWPLFYLKRDEHGSYLDPNGEKMVLPIKNPNGINFERELLAVKHTLRNLTPLQEKIATYYGSGSPTKQWTPVIDRLLDSYVPDPTHAARILAATQAAINDTLLIVWDLKYRFDVARPNQYDQNLQTYLCTPRFPTYPSGHATMSGCAETVLSYLFPKEARKLRKIAEADAKSRLYAGVHFPIDNDEGIELGRYIGKKIVDYMKTQRDSYLNQIDIVYRDDQHAQIFPDDYHQFIPFEFENDCTSLVMGQETSNKDHNTHSPKPTLFL